MSEAYQVEQRLFMAALELPAHQRTGYLRQASAGDAEMIRRVERLLREHTRPENALDAPPEAALAEAARRARENVHQAERPGAQIGRYTLLEKIGEGGCGVVYRAEQREPVRRQVALKIIKLGMDTHEIIMRFGAECQALALMDHPNIARAFDAGATASGRPYFVMELVEGIAITKFCDEARLPPAVRLGLFIEICRAIQHAHQKGVIHRDIKPSNILVTSHGGKFVPKVIDFGVAKAIEGRLTDKTLVTAIAQFIGTPAYVSPEQADFSASGVDTRSDVYSLGVLLYEMLAGRTPFDPRELVKAGLDDMRRQIREVEPPRPSMRLAALDGGSRATIASQRRIAPAKLIELLRGDLDWIVMRCLEKDRVRRYETVEGLALDLERHLRHEPVVARPPSARYMLRKVVRRHRLAFAAGGATAAALCVGIAVSSVLFFREKAARQRAVAAEESQSRLRAQAQAGQSRAEIEAARVAASARFMKEMFSGVGLSSSGRDTTLLREILDRTTKRLDSSLKDQPGVEADLRDTMGDIYIFLGENLRAEAMFRASLALRRKIHGDDALPVAEALGNLGYALHRQERLADAEAIYREALAMQYRLVGTEHIAVIRTLRRLGENLIASRQGPEALATLRQVRAMEARLLPKDDLGANLSALAFARQLVADSKFVEAAAVLRQMLPLYRESHDDPERQEVRAAVLHGLGNVLRKQDRAAEAEGYLREALALRRPAGNDALVRETLSELGDVFGLQHKWAEAAEVLRESTERRTLAAETEPAQKSGWRGVIGSRAEWAAALNELGHHRQAAEVLREALRIGGATGAGHVGLEAEIHFRLADALRGENNLAEAERAYRQAWALEEDLRTWRIHGIALGLMRVLGADGRTAELELIEAGMIEASRKPPGTHYENGPGVFSCELIKAMLQAGRWRQAEALAGEHLARAESMQPQHWATSAYRSLLGAALAGQGNFAAAEPLLIAGYEGLLRAQDEITFDPGARVQEARQQIVNLYTAWGRPEKAAAWSRPVDGEPGEKSP